MSALQPVAPPRQHELGRWDSSGLMPRPGWLCRGCGEPLRSVLYAGPVVTVCVGCDRPNVGMLR